MWKLISYTEAKLPLNPYLSEYILGIVEDSNGKRLIARIDKKHAKNISIGAEGTVKKNIGPQGEINIFIPNLDEKYKEGQKNLKRKIEKIGIVGTGTMGTQLAEFLVQHGFKIVLKSRTEESLEKVLRKIDKRLLKNMNTEEKNMIIKNIEPTTKFSKLFDTDIIIECIIEDEGAKKQLFKKLDNVSKDVILATNTSSLSVNSFASTVSNSMNIIGIHFFNPIKKMQLVEVIKGKNTSQETIERTINFIKELDKIPIIIDDSPGFIVNRLLFSMINEAGYLLMENKASIQEIDTAMKLGAAHPMGPFELADYIGIDVTYEIIKKLSSSILGFKPPAEIFEEMIKNGKLGRKTKKGFYKY